MKKLGKYDVTEKIGQGSFGVVYRSRDPYLKRDLAIKVCSVDDVRLRQRFFREAEISGKLQHRNIVTVFSFGFEGDVPYLVQEYLGGKDLKDLVRSREPIEVLQRLDYLLQIARGLEYAHENGVVHRDIKPANIRVLEDGTVKIMDFGIAKLASAETQLTQKGVTMGTASYLPPEQVRGGDLDHRADLFSFGVLAYELLTYERPFRGKTLSALVYQILYKVPIPISGVWEECPRELSALIGKCLEKNPEHRFQTFGDLLSELEALREQVADGRWPELLSAGAEGPEQAEGSTVEEVMSVELFTATAEELDRRGAGIESEPEVVDSEDTRPIPVLQMMDEDLEDLPDDIESTLVAAAPVGSSGVEDRSGKRELSDEAQFPPLPRAPSTDQRKDDSDGSNPPTLANLDAGQAEVKDSAIRDSQANSGELFKRLIAAGGLVGVLLIFAVVWLVFGRRASEEATSVDIATNVDATKVDPSTEPGTTDLDFGYVVVNARPWARITEISDENGYISDLPADPVTPIRLELAPGRYRLQLENPLSEDQFECELTIVAGGNEVCERAVLEQTPLDYFKASGWWR